MIGRIIPILLMSLMLTAVPLDGSEGQTEDGFATTVTAEFDGTTGSVIESGYNFNLGSSPTHFVENMGQIPREDIYFYSAGGPARVGFMESSILFSMADRKNGHAYVMSFDGSERSIPRALEPADHVSNYFIGFEDKWITGVRSHGRITYSDIYEGVDLTWYIDESGLKYDLLLDPGTDPDMIRIRYEGVPIELRDGDLLITTSIGEAREDSPISFLSDGTPVDSEWRLNGDGSASITVGDYDMRKELVIDPGIMFSTFVGGSNFDEAVAMEIDSSGYVYVAGRTTSNPFPTVTGSYDTSYSGGTNGDGFVLKLDTDGGSLIYSTYLGGSGDDFLNDMTIDSSGNVYVAGQTYSTNYPTQSGSYDTLYANNGDAFVTKLSSTGASLSYSTFLGGWWEDGANAITVDSSGNAYITGETYSQSTWPQWRYPVTSGSYSQTYSGNQDSFVTKINSGGSSLTYSSYLGSNANDEGLAIAVDSSGYAYVTGTTTSTGYPTTSGVYSRTHRGSNEAFITKFSTAGSALSASTFIGGTNNDYGRSLSIDSNGNVLLAGETSSSGTGSFPTTNGAFDTTHNGNYDAFASLLDSSLVSLLYSTFLGGSGNDAARDSHIDSDDNAYLTGYTYSGNFPTTSDGMFTTRPGNEDVFTSILNPTLSTLDYSTYIGSDQDELGTGIAVDDDGLVVIAGTTTSPSFPTSSGAFDTTHNGNADVFALKFFPADFSPSNTQTKSGYFYVNVTWDEPDSSFLSTYTLLGYRVYRTLDSISYEIFDVPASDEYLNNTISDFTKRTYSYGITAVFTTIGESMWSDFATGSPDVTPLPETPTWDQGDMSVNISWDLLSPAFLSMFDISYTLYKGLSPGYMLPLADMGLDTWYNDSEIAPYPGEYYYAVSYHIEGIGESYISEIIETKPNTPPGPPSNQTGERGYHSVSVSWNPPADSGGPAVDEYQILRGLSPDNLVQIDTADDQTRSYVDPVKPGITYYYSIACTNRLGQSPIPPPFSAMGLSTPSAPMNLFAEGGIGLITVSWTPPSRDWGLAISGYSLYRGTDVSTMLPHAELGPKVLNFVDTVENGVEYFYWIAATNEFDEGALAGPVSAVAQTVPGGMGIRSLSVSDMAITLHWEKPEDDGGSPITYYNVYRSISGVNFEPIGMVPAGVYKYRDDGLSNGETYRYKMSASNRNGEGGLSAEVTATPGTAPDRISDIALYPVKRKITVEWSPPTITGGRPILSYRLYRGNGPTSLQPYLTLDSVTTKFEDTDLDASLTYYYAVASVNFFGESDWSAVLSGKPFDVPLSPRITDISAGESTISLAWTEPEFNGGSPVNQYRIEYRAADDSDWYDHITSKRSTILTQLSSGYTYICRVVAISDMGESKPSDTESIMVGRVPNPPLKPKAEGRSEHVVFSWEPRPVEEPIVLAYRIYFGRMDDDNLTFLTEVKSSVSKYEIHGLINGVTYSFQISAVNIIGEGIRTTPRSATPVGRPEPISVLWIEDQGDKMVNISWLPPESDGGLDIRKYEIYRSLDNERFVTAGEVSSAYHFVDRGVDNGKMYYYKITSYNSDSSEGESPFSPVITATPAGTPKSPVDIEWEVTTDEVRLTWAAPGNTGGAPITGYILYKGKSEEDLTIIAFMDPETLEYTDKDVSEGTYYYRLEARNIHGIGEAETVEVDVPSRFSYILLVIVAALMIPVIIFALAAVIPRIRQKRREKEERRKAEEEERKIQEKIKKEKLLSDTSSVRAFGRAPTAQPLPKGAAASSLPSGDEAAPQIEKTREDHGYIRPAESKKKKKDRKTVLRSDGKSIETREKEHHPVMSAPIRSTKDDRFSEERRRVLEEESKKVFTGQQEEGPVESPEEEIPPFMAGPEYEPAVMDEPESIEDIPEWGEEIPLSEPPADEDEGIEFDDELEEMEELDEFEELEE
ncbi:MAG: fibronectin type III domain-containing protein [Thermoplasmatota archaeon]